MNKIKGFFLHFLLYLLTCFVGITPFILLILVELGSVPYDYILLIYLFLLVYALPSYLIFIAIILIAKITNYKFFIIAGVITVMSILTISGVNLGSELDYKTFLLLLFCGSAAGLTYYKLYTIFILKKGKGSTQNLTISN